MTPTDQADSDRSAKHVPAQNSDAFALTLTTLSAYTDAYAVMSHGVMTNAQTGNVIMLGSAVARHDWKQVDGHIWSLVAFLLGVALATHLRRRWLGPHHGGAAHNPLVWVILAHVIMFGAVGLMPASAPIAYVVVPLATVGGMLFELFRSVGDQKYVPVTTTGNLVRLVENLHGALVMHDPTARKALPIHTAVVVVFVGGAVVGAIATSVIGSRAIWAVASGMCVLLLLLIRDH